MWLGARATRPQTRAADSSEREATDKLLIFATIRPVAVYGADSTECDGAAAQLGEWEKEPTATVEAVTVGCFLAVTFDSTANDFSIYTKRKQKVRKV